MVVRPFLLQFSGSSASRTGCLSPPSVENEHHGRLGQETAEIDKHIGDLRADVRSLYEATDLLKQKVESQQAASAKVLRSGLHRNHMTVSVLTTI